MSKTKQSKGLKALTFVINKIWLLVALLVILTAVVFTLLRLSLPYINYYKSDIETWIEEQYGIEVTAENISGQWRSSGPVVSIKNLQVRSSDGQLGLVSVEQISIYVDGISSLLNNNFVSENIEIFGASLDFELGQKLGVRLDPLESDKAEQEDSAIKFQQASQVFLNTLFAQKHVDILNSEITIETLSGRRFNYFINELFISNFDDIHQLTGKLTDDYNGQIKLVAEIFGDPKSSDSYTNLYLEGSNIELAKLPILNESQRLKPDSGDLSWRIWADWKNHQWTNATGDLTLENIQWSKAGNSKEDDQLDKLAELDFFKTQFQWQAINDNEGVFNLHYMSPLNKKKTSSSQTVANKPQAFLVYQQNQTDLQWDLILQEIDIKAFTPYFDLLFGESLPNNFFQGANLSLLIDQVGLRFLRQENTWQSPMAHLTFSNLSYDKLGDLPTVKGISGEVSYLNNTGMAKLMGSKAELNFNELFRNSLYADELAIDFSWALDKNEQIDLKINSAWLKNDDIEIQARSKFYFIEQEPIFSLYAEARNINAVEKSKYLPTGIMDDGLVDYLDNSVKSGFIPLAKAAVHGPLSSFPFDNNEGEFSILGFLQDADFQFQPEWPAVKNLKAELLFEGNGMDIKALGGNAMGILVNNARAVIKDYSEPNTPLLLDIDVTSKDDNAIEYLSLSPLKSIAESVEVFTINGELNTQLAISFGLEDELNLKLLGKVIPDKKDTAITIDKIKVTNIDGAVNFNEKGLVKSELSAKHLDAQLKVKLDEKYNINTQSNQITAQINGDFTPLMITNYIGDEWFDFLQNKAQFNASVLVDATQKDSVVVDFSSDLTGLEIALPDAFYKRKRQQTPFKFSLKYNESETQLLIDWKALSGKMIWDNSKQENLPAAVFYYAVEDTLPENISDEILIKGNLNALTIEPWIDVIAKVKENITQQQADLTATHQWNKKITANLSVENIFSEMIDFDKTELALFHSQENTWTFGMHNKNGNAILRYAEQKPIEIEANDLNLVFNLNDEKANDKEVNDSEKDDNKAFENNDIKEEAKPIQPIKAWEKHDFWPNIDLTCNNCQIQNRHLGDIKLSLNKVQTADDLQSVIQVKGSSINNKKHHAITELNWNQTQVDDKLINKTWTNIHLTTPNINQFMKHWQYPVGIEESKGSIATKLWWNDNPWSFEPKKIEGDASLIFGTGYLSEVSDAKARLFSIFNLQSISRRLKLDFSDIYKKGFFYEKITGDVSLRKGILTTSNVYVDGNAAKVYLSGSLDLNKEQIEQYAFVLPQLTSSLPVLVGWAAEPTTGILVYLMSKIFEPAIDVVTQIEYRIHGDLENLSIDEISKEQTTVKYSVPEDSEEDESNEGEAEQKPVESN